MTEDVEYKTSSNNEQYHYNNETNNIIEDLEEYIDQWSDIIKERQKVLRLREKYKLAKHEVDAYNYRSIFVFLVIIHVVAILISPCV